MSRFLPRPLLPALCAAAALAVTAAQASPTLSLLDLGTGIAFTGVAQQGSPLAAGSDLLALDTRPGDLFGGRRSGVMGVSATGGFGFVATDLIGPAGVPAQATEAIGLSGRGGVAFSSGLYAGVNNQGGLSFRSDPDSGDFRFVSQPALFSTGSDLLPMALRPGAALFRLPSTLGNRATNGLLGTTPDGRLRVVQTNEFGPGVATMASRPLGFAPDTGLARVSSFVVGVNERGSLNVYDPDLDLLFTDVGPAGLFSVNGGLLGVDFNDLDPGLFDAQGDLDDSFGAMGITPDGSLAYVRLDVILGDPSTGPFATLRRDIHLGLDPDSGLALRSGLVTALARDDAAAVPEPGSALLAALALLGLGAARRRRVSAWAPA